MARQFQWINQQRKDLPKCKHRHMQKRPPQWRPIAQQLQLAYVIPDLAVNKWSMTLESTFKLQQN